MSDLHDLSVGKDDINHYFGFVCGDLSCEEKGSGLSPSRLMAVKREAAKLKRHGIDGVFYAETKLARETAAFFGEFFGVKEIRLAEKFKNIISNAWGALLELEKGYKSKNILIVGSREEIVALKNAAGGYYGWSDGLGETSGLSVKKSDNTINFEVKRIPRNESGRVDPHRPFVDKIILSCPKCKGNMRRVMEVADVWYDSGAMPFAQAHWPFLEKSKNKPPAEFPAEYISEAIDQTRGWFYTLLAVSTLLGYSAPYKNVICLGLINDKHGQKMSKSKGNIVDPWEMMNKYGVDAVRWYFFTVNPPGEPKDFDEQELAKSFRKTHLIIYNSLVFWKTYADKSAKYSEKTKPSNALDKWILARLDALISDVTKNFEKYSVREAALAIDGFVDDLSRWYIRRSRRRFQHPENARDYKDASAVLGFVLAELAKLLAPFVPFFAEMLYSEVGGPMESVHLDSWPKSQRSKSGGSLRLLKEMKSVRDFAAIGLAKRAEAGIKVRQPLLSLKFGDAKLKAGKELLSILADEVNVKKIIFDAKTKNKVELDTNITQELREEGCVRDLARMVQELRQKAGLKPNDKIILSISVAGNLRDAIIKREAVLKKETGLAFLEYGAGIGNLVSSEAEIDGQKILIGMRPAK